MGAVDSKVSFRKGIFKLFEERDIPIDDPYWSQFWSLPESENEVYELFGPNDIRRTLEEAPENMESLILALTSRLYTLRHHPSFPDTTVAPAREALNCIRVLSRLMPFLYEAGMDEWETRFWWTKRKVKLYSSTLGSPIRRADQVLFEQTPATSTGHETNNEEFVEKRPLAHELVDTLIDLLFYSGFTIPSLPSGSDKVNLVIWQTGIGCTTPISTTREFEHRKLDILSLLVALMSKPMYQSTRDVPELETTFISYIAGYSNRKVVLTLLCSLLNTVMNYNPPGWKLPYDHVVFTDLGQKLVTCCLQVLVVLLSYDPFPSSPNTKKPINVLRQYYSKIHLKSDFQFIIEGMNRILTQPIEASNSYTSFLPGSQAENKLCSDIMMLFWETFKCNQRFRRYLIDTSTGPDFLVLILYYSRTNRSDASQLGFLRMCIYILQTLTAEKDFPDKLNQLFLGNTSVPSVLPRHFQGSFADFLIIVLSSKGSLRLLYPSLLLCISNIAPYIKSISKEASTKLVNLFTSISSPAFLLAEEGNYILLTYILDIFNRILEVQPYQNPWLVSVILCNRDRFQSLKNFKLENALQEVENIKLSQSSAASKAVTTGIDSKTVTFPERPANYLDISSPVTDDEGVQENSLSSPTSSLLTLDPSKVNVPGGTSLSEKARGKLPEGAGPQSPESDFASLTFGARRSSSLSGVFTPSQEWVDSWFPRLPLYTILNLIEQLTPYLKDNNNPADLVAQLQELCVSSGKPPEIPPSHPFVWTPQANGWYQSMIWGSIFLGRVPLFKGSKIKLFQIVNAHQGPTLKNPRGAVDAVLTTVSAKLGSLGGLGNADTRSPPG